MASLSAANQAALTWQPAAFISIAPLARPPDLAATAAADAVTARAAEQAEWAANQLDEEWCGHITLGMLAGRGWPKLCASARDAARGGDAGGVRGGARRASSTSRASTSASIASSSSNAQLLKRGAVAHWVESC